MKGTREKVRLPAPGWQVLGPGLHGEKPSKAKERLAEHVDLDPLIHERTRLLILTALSTAPEGVLSFLDLREALGLTDGNLMAHLRTLEGADLVGLAKTGAGRGSSTQVTLTSPGAKAFKAYLDQLDALLRAARAPLDHDEGTR
ncbi:MAG: transcriptional regulator [Planctomycetota bacterium]|nr:transcriptional regulator [Planctomycetota bacterium]